MFLIKSTVLILGMALVLAGGNMNFGKPSYLPGQEQIHGKAVWLFRPGAAERTLLLPVMLEEEPVDRPEQPGFDIMVKDAYGFNVSGQWVTGPGPDSIPWGIWFSNSDAKLLVDVRPAVPEKDTFVRHWEETKKTLEQSAEEMLGKDLEAIDFYTRQGNKGDRIYVVEFTGSREERRWYVTVCYRFGENYMAEFIGVNPYSAADCREITMGAARSFRELGKAGPGKGGETQGMGTENWPYPYLHNPFAIAAYYMQEEEPLPSSGKRSVPDYEIG